MTSEQVTIAIVAGSVLILVLTPVVLLMLARRKAARAEEELERVRADLEPLRKYEPIRDAHEEAQRLREAADSYAQGTRSEADRYAHETQSNANRAAEDLERESRSAAKAAREKAQNTIDSALSESDKIIDRANLRAQEIAGDALLAKEKADEFAALAKAMKNVVEGYGDEYLIPSHDLLDELAEEFGHKEAGEELKKARAHTKLLVKKERAADCDYKEPYRRTTAIRFVIDAFNGKVDSTLSKVRHDNLGKLKQAIEDAFALVNADGEAFKNARILPDYRNARLAELKWAVAVHELRVQEREEQRQIREAMREEERARREYEKAMKEAAKEEKMLQQAMEKARKELSIASVQEQEALQAQLAELEEKLREAEEKNQRAISMAQQTRRGHVYVISNVGSFGEQVFKIGLTRRLEPLDRVRELGDASVPFPFDVHAMMHSEDAPALETELHRKFERDQVNRVNPRKEFFRVSLRDVRGVVDAMGIEAHWTMAAEAQEYRETLALQRSEPSADAPDSSVELSAGPS